MAKLTVVKRSGKRQGYSPAKVKNSIEKAAKDAKVPAAKRRKLAAELATSLREGLKGKRSVKTVDLRRRILDRLSRCSKKSVKAWQRYDRKRH